MSRLWNIAKAIREVDGEAALGVLHGEWLNEYFHGDREDYIAFQHFVQINHRKDYNRYVAYARLQGWV